LAHTAPIGAAAVQGKGAAHRAAVVGGIKVIKNKIENGKIVTLNRYNNIQHEENT
jgi:hypothetical protein